jgi:hypothetical protein
LLRGQIVAILTLIYFISCFIFFILWLKGKHYSKYFLLGLGLIHLISFSFLISSRNWNFDDTRFIFYSSLIMNLILILTIVLSKTKKSNLEIK